MKKTLTFCILLFAFCIFLTACGGFTQDDIDSAVNEATSPLDEQIAALEAEIATLEAEIAEMKAEIAALEGEKNSLTTKKAELEASITAKDAEISNLNSSIATLQAEKQALADGIAELEAKNEDLEKENEILKNCVVGIHSFTVPDNGNGDGTHTATCICGKEEVHESDYIDNGDGTHTLACHYCDYADTDTTEDHYEHVDREDCICSLCGAEHYLPYADEGKCYCTYCGEYIHSINENCVCTTCSLTFHTVDSTTGICSKCNNFGPAASITHNGVTTYYNTFDEALVDAMENNSCTIVLENDCHRYTTQINGGNIIIDLNGKTLGCGPNTSYSLVIYSGNVTVKDSAGGGKSLDLVGAFGGTTTLESGSFGHVLCSDSGITNIVGGEYEEVSINSGSAKLTISGGNFSMVTAYERFYTLDQLLDDGYCYYDAEGKAIDASTLEPNGYWYELINVTVGAAEQNS